MPKGTEQRTIRADLKTQVLSLLLLFGAAGSASASTPGYDNCHPAPCASRFETVDYEIRQSEPTEVEKADRDSLKKSSLALTTKQDTSIRREAHPDAKRELPTFDDDATDPVSLLLERRSLERGDDDDSETPTMKSALPGVNAEELRIFREKMYRTDI